MQVQEWLEAVAAELGVADAPLDEGTVRRLLDLTRDVAHEVERPAAPLTTFVLGLAVGRGADVDEAVEVALALLEGPATPREGAPATPSD